MRTATQIAARGVTIVTPAGRHLIRNLEMRLDSDRVAVVGRNGVGKSMLLEALAGLRTPATGRVECRGSRWLVPQVLGPGHDIAATVPMSAGELRRERLAEARRERPDFLLLDEPSQDLDAAGIDWLTDWLGAYGRGLIVVTHERRLLRLFTRYFVVEESGCRLFCGSFDELLGDLERRAHEANMRYAAELHRLLDREQHNATTRRRRARKRALGRVRELDRCPARIRLNAKRGYAQVYQGKREGVREQRIAAARELARSVRRALMVDLPLELEMPDLPARAGQPIIAIDGVTASARGSCLFESLTLSIERERLAVVGPNGSGKTTLLEIMVGARVPDAGVARSMRHRLGYVAQHAQNWLSNESLAALLLTSSDAETLSDVARHLACHRFPLALAERPLWTLSPGERTRAALLCLYRRHPPVELLVLDEPTDQLDLVGVAALERALAAWPGGLVVVSHDEEFLERVGVTARVELGQGRAKCSGQPA